MLLITISFIAGFTSTISLIPQILKTYKSKSANDISSLMIINFTICSISWIIYGYMINALSVIITNVIMTFFSILLLILKISYSPKHKNDKANN